jgi:hypothetical protein
LESPRARLFAATFFDDHLTTNLDSGKNPTHGFCRLPTRALKEVTIAVQHHAGPGVTVARDQDAID